MLDGDEVVCAILDADADAGVAHAAAAIAAATGLPLVLTAIDGGSQGGGLVELAADLPGEVLLRAHPGRSAAVLRGLGRALGTALLVVTDAARPLAPLLDAPGCPLVLVPRDEAALALRTGGALRCVVEGARGGEDDGARRLADLLPAELGVIPAHASVTAGAGDEVVVLVRSRAQV